MFSQDRLRTNARKKLKKERAYLCFTQAALGHKLSYLGFHNESPWEIDWVVHLRAELNRRGKQHVQLVVADCGPNFQTKAAELTDFFHNKTTSATAGAVGLHYPNSILPARLNPEYLLRSTLP